MREFFKELLPAITGVVSLLAIIWSVILTIAKNSQIPELSLIAKKVGFWATFIVMSVFFLYVVKTTLS